LAANLVAYLLLAGHPSSPRHFHKPSAIKESHIFGQNHHRLFFFFFFFYILKKNVGQISIAISFSCLNSCCQTKLMQV
jgi:hypothetical protein